MPSTWLPDEAMTLEGLIWAKLCMCQLMLPTKHDYYMFGRKLLHPQVIKKKKSYAALSPGLWNVRNKINEKCKEIKEVRDLEDAPNARKLLGFVLSTSAFLNILFP